MTGLREAFVGIDAAKLRNAVAIADAGRDGEIRYIGEVDASPESMRRLIGKLASKYDQLQFCYEAGPTGYGPKPTRRLRTQSSASTIMSCVGSAPAGGSCSKVREPGARRPGAVAGQRLRVCRMALDPRVARLSCRARRLLGAAPADPPTGRSPFDRSMLRSSIAVSASPHTSAAMAAAGTAPIPCRLPTAVTPNGRQTASDDGATRPALRRKGSLSPFWPTGRILSRASEPGSASCDCSRISNPHGPRKSPNGPDKYPLWKS